MKGRSRFRFRYRGIMSALGGIIDTTSKYLLDLFANDFEVANEVSTFNQTIGHSASTNATMTSGYGPELVTNGTFDTDVSGWTDAAGDADSFVAENGRAKYVNSVTGVKGIFQDITVQAGKAYEITADIEAVEAATLFNTYGQAGFGSQLSTHTVASGTSETVSVIVTSATSTIRVYIATNAAGTRTFYADNISVREMPSIKWRPHNLLKYSEDFSGVLWTKDNVTVLGSTITDSITVGGQHSIRQSTVLSGNAFDGQQITAEAELKAGTKRWAWLLHLRNTAFQAFFDLENGVVGTVSSGCSASMTATTDGKYICRLSLDAGNVAVGTGHQVYVGLADADNNRNYNGDGTGTIECYGVWSYRSDLGGMVDNPDRSDSYVPTTSSAVYLPRRGHHIYNGYEWVNEGMLHESEARTNNIYSQDFTDPTYWSEQQVTVTPDSTVSPDGTQNASLVTETAVSSYHRLAYAVTNTGTTVSVYLKKHSRRYVGIRFSLISGYENAAIDLDTQSFGYLSANVDSTTVEDVGNGWFRYSISAATNITNFGIITSNVAITSDAIPNFLGATDQGVYIWGVQSENGFTPSSYIPTSGATVTRAAESLTIPAANLPWPTPEVIGSELVTNGDFSGGLTGWTQYSGVPSDIDTSSGAAVFTHSATNVAAYQEIATEAGKVYQLTADVAVLSGSAGNVALNVWDGAFATQISNNQPPLTTSDPIVFVALGTVTRVVPYIQSSGTSASFDNISVKEIDPLAVSIQMNGRMTSANVAGTNQNLVFWYKGLNDSIVVEYETFNQRFDFSQKANSVVDRVLSGTFLNGVFVPFNIASRHGSTFINGAIDGVALTANTTPTALPDLSATDLDLGYDFMGTIRNFQIWDRDIGDQGLVDETAPSLEPSLFLTFDGTTGSYTVTDWSE